MRLVVVALARMTALDSLRQPATWLTTGISLLLLWLSYSFGLFNFDAEDRLRMLATAGVAVGVINGLLLGVLLVSQAVHDELASRTALTLFAKPVERSEYLTGKVLGAFLAVATAGVLLAAAHALLLWWGARCGFADGFCDHDHGHDHGHQDEALPVPWSPILAAHLLGLCHAAVMAMMAGVAALRLPLTANLTACAGVFLLGHVLAGAGWFGAGVIPALSAFNLDEHIQFAHPPLPGGYVAAAGLYSALFCAGCLAVGVALFQRQDIP